MWRVMVTDRLFRVGEFTQCHNNDRHQHQHEAGAFAHRRKRIRLRGQRMNQQAGQNNREHDRQHHLKQRANLFGERAEHRRQRVVCRKAFSACKGAHRLFQTAVFRPAGHVQRNIRCLIKIQPVHDVFNARLNLLLRVLCRADKRNQHDQKKKRRKPFHCSAPTAICVNLRKIGRDTPSRSRRPQSSARQAIDGASMSRQTCAANCVINTMPIARSIVCP